MPHSPELLDNIKTDLLRSYFAVTNCSGASTLDTIINDNLSSQGFEEG